MTGGLVRSPQAVFSPSLPSCVTSDKRLGLYECQIFIYEMGTMTAATF